MSLHCLGVFKYLYQCHCLDWGYLNQKGSKDRTGRDRRTQPFIVKDFPSILRLVPFPTVMADEFYFAALPPHSTLDTMAMY